MIGKIKKGSGFKGCVNYVLGKEQAALLHADGVLTESRGDIIRSFYMQTGMNPDLKKPVGHIALSYSAVDAPKLTDEKMIQLAQEYMREMKITDTQYIIVRHQDREHPHQCSDFIGRHAIVRALSLPCAYAEVEVVLISRTAVIVIIIVKL